MQNRSNQKAINSGNSYPVSAIARITQERRAPSNDSGGSGLVNDVLSDSDEEDTNDDDDLHVLPSDEEIRAKDAIDANIEFDSAFKKW